MLYFIRIKVLLKKKTLGAGAGAQKFKALAALAKDLDLVPSTHMVALNHF